MKDMKFYSLLRIIAVIKAERVMQKRLPELGLSQVWSGLWVGPARSVTAHELATRGITTLIWATPEVSPPQLPDIHVLEVLIKDDPDQDISLYFQSVAKAFKECQANGSGMAVVCRAGVSRSACLALAALVGQPQLQEMTLRNAYLTVKGARPLIRPNNGFFSQLIRYEVAMRGSPSVTMNESPYQAGEQVPDVYLEELKKDMGSTFTTFLPY
ncbi:dual specificity protein phosphatase 14-like isoform X2 [Panulirus ornatus]|uniref:dual specificity protein phosphatase 14-like isoform X2 n=2 Tax=Panulirus ornatus TaxID=150431 RepID=UPI003A846A52